MRILQMSILQMSVTGGILIAGMIIFRSVVMNHVPKRLLLCLWMIAMVRLLCPLSLSVSIPGIGIPDRISGRIQDSIVADRAEAEFPVAEDGVCTTVMESVSSSSAQRLPNEIFRILWLAGTGLCGAVFLFFYYRDREVIKEAILIPPEEEKKLMQLIQGKLRTGQNKSIHIKTSERLNTPMVSGIIRPVILFPKTMKTNNEKIMTMIVNHEAVHIRNRDNLQKLLMIVTVCLHWFNPFVWMMYLLFNRDMELACDEAVIKIQGIEGRKEYAFALLTLAEQKNGGFLTGMCFGKNAAKERIEAIMKYKKLTLPGIIAATAVITAALTVFVTSAEAKALKGENSDTYIAMEEGTSDTNTILEGMISYEMESEGKAIAADSTEAEETGTFITPQEEQEKLRKFFSAYEEYGLTVTVTDADYQLYYNGEKVCYFADNRLGNDTKDFSGTVYAHEPGKTNGLTAVITNRNDKGEVIGLIQLSEEETLEYRKGHW